MGKKGRSKRKKSSESENEDHQAKQTKYGTNRFSLLTDDLNLSELLSETNNILYNQSPEPENSSQLQVFESPAPKDMASKASSASSPEPSNSDLMKVLEKLSSRLSSVETKLSKLSSLETKVEKFDQDLAKMWNSIKDQMKNSIQD